MKKRHLKILMAIQKLGDDPNTRQIALETGLHVNGVSQSLKNALHPQGYVKYSGGLAGEMQWCLLPKGTKELKKRLKSKPK